MADLPLQQIVTRLRRVVQPGGDSTDGQLLTRFIAHHEEAAFAALVQRHGPMVLGVCRRVLGNAHDADDAFQATFLILVHKAASLKSCELVGNWLYGVAYRTALAAGAASQRRRSTEKQVIEMPEPAVTPTDDGSELRLLLDQELSRLADVYREAIVLCDLEGKTRKEAAQQLGIPEGTLSGRLTTARRQLAKRLSRRGLVLSGTAIAIALSQSALSACVPDSLVALTAKAASAVATGSVTAGTVSANVVVLTQGVLKTMSTAKVKTITAVVLTFFLTAGVALVGHARATPVSPQDQPVVGNGQKTAEPAPAPLAVAQDQPGADKDQPKANPKRDEPKKREATNVPAIKKIVVQGNSNVTFQQGGNQTLKGATADDVKDGVLYLTGKEDVIIDLKELPEVLLQGGGSFTGKGLQTKRAVLVAQGSNKIDLSGTADEQVITIQGGATFDGRNLKGMQGTVSMSGSGEVFVNVTDTLKATVFGSGSVRYLGSPKVEDHTVGGGTIQAVKAGEKPSVKPTPKVVPDPKEEKIRQLEAELKKLQEELNKLKKP